MVLLRWATAAAVAVAALTGCGRPSSESTLNDAREACTMMSAGDGNSSSNGSSGDISIAFDEWVKVQDHVRKASGLAASAARRDPRWEELSQGLTSFEQALEQRLVIENPSTEAAEKEQAQATLAALDPASAYRSIDRECRIARAQ
ncbi:hypothetical protein ACIGN6_31405 [Streptomyces sp. NPDC053792]|uniref:hypothetical protein n=1 Tax=Streptomyces sp. NPDC053792 TaxID=3365716 RepID=UPI0037D60291